MRELTRNAVVIVIGSIAIVILIHWLRAECAHMKCKVGLPHLNSDFACECVLAVPER